MVTFHIHWRISFGVCTFLLHLLSDLQTSTVTTHKSDFSTDMPGAILKVRQDPAVYVQEKGKGLCTKYQITLPNWITWNFLLSAKKKTVKWTREFHFHGAALETPSQNSEQNTQSKLPIFCIFQRMKKMQGQIPDILSLNIIFEQTFFSYTDTYKKEMRLALHFKVRSRPSCVRCELSNFIGHWFWKMVAMETTLISHLGILND